MIVKESMKPRLTDSVEVAGNLTNGLVFIDVIGGEMHFQSYACPEHGISVDELSPRMFSFNSPFGACPSVRDLGS